MKSVREMVKELGVKWDVCLSKLEGSLDKCTASSRAVASGRRVVRPPRVAESKRQQNERQWILQMGQKMIFCAHQILNC